MHDQNSKGLPLLSASLHTVEGQRQRMKVSHLPNYEKLNTVVKYTVNIFNNLSTQNRLQYNQVVWAPVARNSFQGRTRGIPGSILRGNDAWPVRMPLRTRRISHPPLVGRKPVRKQKKKIDFNI